MFIITVEGKSFQWDNRLDQNFLQFLPKHFTKVLGKEITKDDITVHVVDFKDEVEVEKYHNPDDSEKEWVKVGNKLELRSDKPGEYDGSKPVGERETKAPEKKTKDKEITLGKISVWPYHATLKDKSGRPLFLGNKLDGE